MISLLLFISIPWLAFGWIIFDVEGRERLRRACLTLVPLSILAMLMLLVRLLGGEEPETGRSVVTLLVGMFIAPGALLAAGLVLRWPGKDMLMISVVITSLMTIATLTMSFAVFVMFAFGSTDGTLPMEHFTAQVHLLGVAALMCVTAFSAYSAASDPPRGADPSQASRAPRVRSAVASSRQRWR